MNPAPCIPIEAAPVFHPVDWLPCKVYTRTQIRKGLLRVWNPGESTYQLWVSQDITWPGRHRNAGNRWWQPPADS